MQLNEKFVLQKAILADILAYIRKKLNKYRLDEREILRAELFAEEVLIRWMAVATENDTVNVLIKKRFFSITLTLVYKGDMLDPMSDEDSEMDEKEFANIGQQILIGLSHVQYSYKNGLNKIVYPLKKRGINSGMYILIALVTALIAGFVFHEFFPILGSKISSDYLYPVTQAFFGLLTAIAIPFLFISVVASMINMENISQMKTIFSTLFWWIFALTLVTAVITLFAGMIYFPASKGYDWLNTVRFVPKLTIKLKEIIPDNIIAPFIQNNTLQVTFLALFFGATILFLKSRFTFIVKLVSELHQILSTTLDLLCAFIPLVIFISLFSILVNGQGLVLLCLITVLLIEKEKPASYMRKIMPVLFIALTTANSGSTFISHSKVAVGKQGIRDYLSNFSIPVGALFSKPFMALVVFMVTLFMGQFYHLSFGFQELVSLLLLSILCAIAVPPMAGMGIFLFSVTLNSYGIPIEGMAMAVTLYTFLDYLLTAVDVFSVNISMLHTEYHLRKKEKILKNG
jgi:Na+/H+-dicarboxylate symporter